MKASFVSAVICACTAGMVSAQNNWAGSNNYYIGTLPEEDRLKMLDAMQDAGMKVLRTWVTGHGAGQKGSSSTEVADVENGGIGQWDDTILDQIDQVMVEAHDRGIKLLIGMYDQNSLYLGNDIYYQNWGTSGFYTNSDAISAFNERITHILNGHKNKLIDNLAWSELGDYIFGFEAQNEPMIRDQDLYNNNLQWICNTAKQIRNNVGNPDILITTGGGSAAASIKDEFLSADCLVDVISVHDYNDDYNSFLGDAVQKAQDAGKKIIVEEWGSLYGDGRVGNLQDNVKQITAQGVPWLYWQTITNGDPHEGEDYEIEVGGENWDTLKQLSLDTAGQSGAFDFSASLL